MSFKGGPTIFGRVPEKNVCFLIDTSGSMYHQLPFVKEHLVEALSNRASVSRDSMFNIIVFNDDTEKWAHKLVQCSPCTIEMAARWINGLTCGTSTNTMGALLEAFDDNAVEAVYMVTDGLPDQRPAVILESLKSMPKRMPVHSIYLNGPYSDPTSHDFLRDLAEQTRGSFHVIRLNDNGRVQKVIPIYNAKPSYVQQYDAGTSVDTTTLYNADSKFHMDLEKPPASGYVSRTYDKYPLPITTVGNLMPQHSVFYEDRSMNCSKNTVNSKIINYADAVIKARGLAESAGIRYSSVPLACSLMKGMKVLARRDLDGLYYFGEVKEQVSLIEKY